MKFVNNIWKENLNKYREEADYYREEINKKIEKTEAICEWTKNARIQQAKDYTKEIWNWKEKT